MKKSGADINKLIAALTEVIQQYKCAVLLVHHTGHSEAAKHRARGASELPAAVDHEFRVEPYDEEGVLVGTLFTNTKSKDTAQRKPDVVLRPKQSGGSLLELPLRCDTVGGSVGL